MKQKLPLLLILLIGVLTPLLSTALFFFWRPAAQVNIGEVLPPQPLPAAGWRTVGAAAGEFSPQEWRGDWVLLMAGGAACDDICRRRLCQMRQLRLMLPGNYLRLRRAWLITDEAAPPQEILQETGCGELPAEGGLQAPQEDTLDGVELLHAAAETLPAGAAGGASGAAAESYLYLVDPTGIWAMRFAPDLGIYQIRKDIKRLLRISKGLKFTEAEEGNE